MDRIAMAMKTKAELASTIWCTVRRWHASHLLKRTDSGLTGDKETFWIGWELVGDRDYAFHPGDAGVMGVVKQKSSEESSQTTNDNAEESSEKTEDNAEKSSERTEDNAEKSSEKTEDNAEKSSEKTEDNAEESSEKTEDDAEEG